VVQNRMIGDRKSRSVTRQSCLVSFNQNIWK